MWPLSGSLHTVVWSNTNPEQKSHVLQTSKDIIEIHDQQSRSEKLSKGPLS
jgi:hypothetical protein